MKLPTKILSPAESPALKQLRLDRPPALVAAGQVLDTLDQPATITDRSNRLIYVNPAFLRLYRYNLAFILGKTPLTLIPRRFSPARLREIYRGIMAGRWQGELENVDAEGRRFIYKLDARPLVLANGDGQYFIGLGRRVPLETTGTETETTLVLPLAELSPQERAVFKHLRLGRTAKEIAESLHISHHTVATLKRRIYFKLGFENQTGLYQFLLRQIAKNCFGKKAPL